MAKITNEMTHTACMLAKDVYLGLVSKSDAITKLKDEFEMNSGSASDYIVNFKNVMTGKSYKRTFNTYATDYLLTLISDSFSSKYYSNAISAVRKHIKYYENLRNVHLKSIRRVLVKHERLFNNLETMIDYPDEIHNSKNLYEGVKKTIIVNSYERNHSARVACLRHYGFSCSVCDFSFIKYYGDIGKEYIHVHHLIPVSSIAKNYQVDPIKDLRPVCPNCHAMLHKNEPPLTIEELRIKIRIKKETI